MTSGFDPNTAHHEQGMPATHIHLGCSLALLVDSGVEHWIGLYFHGRDSATGYEAWSLL